MEWIWVLIPLAGIALGGFEAWLKARKEQLRLGLTTNALEGDVTKLRQSLDTSEAERRALAERVENLETIVTSRLWGAVREAEPNASVGSLSEAERERRLADLDTTLARLPKDEPTAAQKAARLADELEV